MPRCGAGWQVEAPGILRATRRWLAGGNVGKPWCGVWLADGARCLRAWARAKLGWRRFSWMERGAGRAERRVGASRNICGADAVHTGMALRRNTGELEQLKPGPWRAQEPAPEPSSGRALAPERSRGRELAQEPLHEPELGQELPRDRQPRQELDQEPLRAKTAADNSQPAARRPRLYAAEPVTASVSEGRPNQAGWAVAARFSGLGSQWGT